MDSLHYLRMVPVGIWPVLVTHFILNMVNCTSRHVEKAFFRTLVSCDPSPLVSEASHWHRWTGSAHCEDVDLVLRRGLFVEGQMWFLTVMMHVPLLPFVAAATDRWGRRPILIIATFGFITFQLLLAASQHWDNAAPSSGTSSYFSQGRMFDLPCFAFVAFVFRGVTFNFGVVWAAMLFDLTENLSARACAFALLEVSNQVGEMLGSLMAAHIEHLRLLDYRSFYLCSACVCVLALMHVIALVPETLPASVAEPGMEKVTGRRPSIPVAVRSMIEDVYRIASSRKLRPLYVGEFLRDLSAGSDLLTAPLTIAAYSWKQGDYELYAAPFPLLVLLSTVFMVPVLTSRFDGKIPEWFLCRACVVNIVVLLVAMWTPLHPFFLLAPRYISSSLAFQSPLLNARLTNLVDANGQAKLHAIRGASSCLAAGIGFQIFTSGYFFDPTSKGMIAMAPFMASSLLGSLSALSVLVVAAPRSFGRFFMSPDIEDDCNIASRLLQPKEVGYGA